MPTYQYRCGDCGHEFEVIQSMKEDKLKTCPACGKETLQRLIGSGSGLIFKGSGFYLTDYVKKDAGTPKPASKATDSKTAPAKESTPPATKDQSKSESAPSTARKDTPASDKK
ncbi:MAG: zinc ribbon domain-containing protein [Ignavibacteria bacterium]|nr:zinc ribbon domain-containing protein [Ignavibacteria bacterium]